MQLWRRFCRLQFWCLVLNGGGRRLAPEGWRLRGGLWWWSRSVRQEGALFWRTLSFVLLVIHKGQRWLSQYSLENMHGINFVFISCMQKNVSPHVTVSTFKCADCTCWTCRSTQSQCRIHRPVIDVCFLNP